ncbi:MAG: hypothetical protein U0638_05395 [Phycisphaerales bacterium]
MSDPNGMGRLFSPTPAASVWRTLGKLPELLFAAAWLVALPVELIAHARVGKRYANTLFSLLAWAGSLALAAFLMGGIPDPDHPTPQAIAFFLLFILSAYAFLLHHVDNRERFGTEWQGHSFDCGIPWFLHVGLWKLFARLPMPAASPLHSLNCKRLMGMPASTLPSLPAMLRHHAAMLVARRPPHGPFTWLCISVVEPVLLLAIGGVLLATAPMFKGFALYLGLVGAAMWLKASLHAAAWRERAYDDWDQHLEAHGLSIWRGGQLGGGFAPSFTIPLYSAIVPPPPTERPEPLQTPAGFEALMLEAPGQ